MRWSVSCTDTMIILSKHYNIQYYHSLFTSYILDHSAQCLAMFYKVFFCSFPGQLCNIIMTWSVEPDIIAHTKFFSIMHYKNLVQKTCFIRILHKGYNLAMWTLDLQTLVIIMLLMTHWFTCILMFLSTMSNCLLHTKLMHCFSCYLAL